MFKDKTVFVIGAGASAEFGMPVGSALMKEIKGNSFFAFDAYNQLKQGNEWIWEHYRRVFNPSKEENLSPLNVRLNALRKISLGIDSADSIDEYIYRYSNDPIIAEVGKLQIAYSIASAEEKCILNKANNNKFDLTKAENTWIWSFYKTLINGVKATELDRIGDNITIITFNYDRTIEHYLEQALTRSFHGVKIDEARDIVKQIEIVHPYGSLGDLADFDFGDVMKFSEMAENIVTWSESVRDDDLVRQMKYAIGQAKRIVFMGFAFAKQNMKLLDAELSMDMEEPPVVYTCAYGIPHEVEGSLGQDIARLYTGDQREAISRMHFQYGAKCKEFFDIHRMNLAD